jgi:hypothetical protein
VSSLHHQHHLATVNNDAAAAVIIAAATVNKVAATVNNAAATVDKAASGVVNTAAGAVNAAAAAVVTATATVVIAAFGVVSAAAAVVNAAATVVNDAAIVIYHAAAATVINVAGMVGAPDPPLPCTKYIDTPRSFCKCNNAIEPQLVMVNLILKVPKCEIFEIFVIFTPRNHHHYGYLDRRIWRKNINSFFKYLGVNIATKSFILRSILNYLGPQSFFACSF